MLKSHYFLIVIAPYLVSILLLFFLIILYLSTKKKILLFFALVPFLDTLFNIIAIPIAYFMKGPNDFLNLFRFGFYWETILIMISPLILFLILYINYKKAEAKKGEARLRKK